MPETGVRAGVRYIGPVAVYTPLSLLLVNNMSAVFPEVSKSGQVIDVEGIAQGSINTTFRVTLADGAVWFLRVNEGKTFEALVHERDVLAALAAVDVGVVTPRMALSVPGGSFFPIDLADGRRWASWFQALPGRDLAVFEVTPDHTAQIGAALARCHLALKSFGRRRRNPFGLPVVRAWLRELARTAVTKNAALLPVIQRLSAALDGVSRRRRPLRLGLVHGDLFIDNTKWQEGRLRAIFDWEMAGRDHLALDVAISVCAWAFARGSHLKDAVLTISDDKAAALVEGYQRVRPLSAPERRGFFNEMVLAAARFTTSRMRDFEMQRGDQIQRRHLDYRDFLARLDSIEGRGDRALRSALGLR